MKINIVHIVEDLKTGGLERVIAGIVTGIDPERFNLKIWCLFRGGDIYDELKAQGVNVEILGMQSHRDIGFMFKLIRRLKENNIHIIHTHGYTGTTLGRIAGIIAGVKIILAHVHSTYWDFSFKQLCIEKILSLATDKIICCSESVANFVKGREKVNKDKVTVIYNGVDLDKFILKDNQITDKDEYVIGCIASLFAHKGHKYLLAAIKSLISDCSKKIRLILVGEGQLKDELQDYCRKLGIEKNVKFVGNVLDISEILKGFDIVVLPSSEREGLGIALLEAMAVGIPIIGTTIGGIPEIIQNGINGILIEPKNSGSLASAINSMLDDFNKAKTMGATGRKIVEAKFSQEKMLQKISGLYQILFDQKYGK
ncbi:MAG: glycosyltransferase [Candidatus Omnitrophota bacterium]